MTLQEHTNYCLELVKQGYGNLPIISASDSEGNNYEKVYNKPSEFRVENLNSYYLEPVFEYDEDILLFKPNCIIIN